LGPFNLKRKRGGKNGNRPKDGPPHAIQKDEKKNRQGRPTGSTFKITEVKNQNDMRTETTKRAQRRLGKQAGRLPLNGGKRGGSGRRRYRVKTSERTQKMEGTSRLSTKASFNHREEISQREGLSGRGGGKLVKRRGDKGGKAEPNAMKSFN